VTATAPPPRTPPEVGGCDDLLATLEYAALAFAPQSGAARRRVTFLIDAQLPERLVRFLREHGHDAVHSSR